MKVSGDDRLEEFKRIERLLFGFNYCVWFNLYGPVDSAVGLQEVLKNEVSQNAVVSGVVASTVEDAKNEIMSCVLYEGDVGSGPIDPDKNHHLAW